MDYEPWPSEALTTSGSDALTTPTPRPGWAGWLAAVAFVASAGVMLLIAWNPANAFDVQGKYCAQEAFVWAPSPPNNGQCGICDDPPRCALCLTAGEPDAAICETPPGGVRGQWNHAQCWPIPHPGSCGVSCIMPTILFAAGCVADDPQNPTTCDCTISLIGFDPYHYTSVTFCEGCQ